MTFQQWALCSAVVTATAGGFVAGLAMTGAPLLGVSAAILLATAAYHSIRLSRSLI